ncbi:MAG: murein biosynthesis integral membrane protein MurJ [Bryobacteraceae bacterium]|nr:murein biosynthesis integral membrane protein MurJ [Bryobacteraceae bacterium]
MVPDSSTSPQDGVQPPKASKLRGTGRHAFLVASGILLSRLVGLVRQRAFNHYFGQSDQADAFNAAFKIPNFLQNLFGEGVLSASFIPVYSRSLAKGDEEESGRIAGAILAILTLSTTVLVGAGVLLTPFLIDAIAPGFHGAKRELTIRLVQILFPGAGLLVISAWCLGILNSHRKFFLSYTAPVVWNLAMIATLLGFGGRELPSLAIYLACGSVAGSALQLGVQLPAVLSLVRHLRPRLDTASEHVREVLKNFVPVFVSRGVVQISAYVDQLFASLLGTGAVAALTNAQTLYTLPVSLFGMSISAAELPAMSSALGAEEDVAAQLRQRLNSGLRRIAFFVVPSAMAFLALGGAITAALFETGRFHHGDSNYVWGILAGSSVGLLASTLGRLYSSTYYALRDTRTPLRFAIVRVFLTVTLGYVCAIWLPRWMGIEQRWGVAGLTASAGVAGWVEFALLRRALNARIGRTGLPATLVAKLWSAAGLAAALAWAVKAGLRLSSPFAGSLCVLAVYGAGYIAAAWVLRVEECEGLVRQALARSGRRRRQHAS